MKVNLPLIGTIKLGKDAIGPVHETVSATPKIVDKSYDVLSGALSFGKTSLSSETTVSHKLLEANKDWVYRNNDVIAQEVSAIEFELFSVDLKGGEIEYNLIEDHPLLDLLDKFNSRTTKSDGIYITQSHKKLTGDAFWLLDKRGSSVQNIFILPPDKVEIVLADPTKASGDLIAEYKYIDTIGKKSIEQRYGIDEIIHFKKPNPNNPFRGYGAVEALADTIDTDNLTNAVQRNFFEKGAIGNFVLVTEANLTQDQIKRMKAEFQAAYGGAKNSFKAMLFGNGIKPMDIGFSNKDMEFLSLLEWYMNKIMVGFGNTKASIGIIDDVNRASYESSLGGWLRGTVKPDMNSIVQTINEFLVPMYGDNLVLGYKDPIPKNVEEDTKQAVELKKAGIIQINEAREMVGMNPIEGGDVFAPDKDPALPISDVNDQASSKKKTVYKNKLPPALAHFNIEPILRRQTIYFKKRIHRDAKAYITPIIRDRLNKKSNKDAIPPAQTISYNFTDDILEGYYEKQTKSVEENQKEFYDRVLALLDMVESQTLSNLESEIPNIKALKRFMVKKELFNEEDIKTQAQLDLNPILMTQLIQAGQEAFRLIGIEDTYVPYKAQASIREMIDRFADSMLATDKDKLTSIILDGIESGSSVAEIRDAIKTDFGKYSKTQAERIARTEVLRAASKAEEDAFIQSGVVEAKQWLVAPNACAICAPYSGKIKKLGKDFYSPDDSGFQDGNPPLHVNCRCRLIPVVTGTTSFKPNNAKQLEVMAERIAELESKVDKRTKAYKKLKAEYQNKSTDDEVYIKSLEKHLGIADEQ